jgi:hypothetical protein
MRLNLKQGIFIKYIHSGLFLRRGSSRTSFVMYSKDANDKRTCSINLGKLLYLQSNSCFTQLITHSNT